MPPLLIIKEYPPTEAEDPHLTTASTKKTLFYFPEIGPTRTEITLFVDIYTIP